MLVVGYLSFAAGAWWENRHRASDLESHLFRRGEARKSTGDWGSIAIYTSDATATFGTSSLLTAELEFLPGKRLQPPHQHANEEFQYVIEGTGTWSVNGQEIPLQAGDLLYTKPWDWHGIANTGTTPLRFFVFKWISQGAAAPAPK